MPFSSQCSFDRIKATVTNLEGTAPSSMTMTLLTCTTEREKWHEVLSPIVRPFPRNFKAKYNKCWSQENDDLNHILFSYIHASWCIHFAMSSHLQPPCKSNQPTYHSLAVKILVVFLRMSISSLHPLQPQSMTSATPTNFSILSMTVVMCRGVQMGSPATKTGPKQHWKVLWLSRSWPEGADGQPYLQMCN